MPRYRLRYSTSGSRTWTCPTGVTSVRVMLWAAGGGGGAGSTLYGGGGGAGGGYSESTVTVSAGTGYAVSVPAAAAAGAAGGNCTFASTTVVAKGGGAGGAAGFLNGGSAGASGGLGTGTIRYTGAAGVAGNLASGGAGGGGAGSQGNAPAAPTAGSPDGGAGGASNGGTGTQPGGGGGGGAILSGAGGPSAAGLAILEWETPTDPLTLSDTFSRVVVFNRGEGETLTVTDLPAKDIHRPVTEAVTVADTEFAIDYKLVQDEASATDDDATAHIQPRRAEELTAADAIAKDYAMPLPDGVALSDDIDKLYAMLLPEGVAFADDLDKLVALPRDENLTAADAIDKLYTMPLPEALSATDDDSVKDYRKNLAEPITAADLPNKDIRVPLGADYGAADDITITLIFLRYFDETAQAVDAIAKVMATPKADSIDATDLMAAHPYLSKTDALTVADSISKLWLINRLPEDSVTATDAQAKRLAVKFADSISGAAPPVTTSKRMIVVLDD